MHAFWREGELVEKGLAFASHSSRSVLTNNVPLESKNKTDFAIIIINILWCRQ